MEPEDPIEDAWQRVLAEWEDERVHKRFVTLCASTEQLGEAGRRYREVRERDAERAPVAAQQIDRVLALAMQNLGALKSERPRRNPKTVLFLVALGVSGAMILTALSVLLRVL